MRFAKPQPFRGGKPWPVDSYKFAPLVTWFENPESGLRFLGRVDAIAKGQDWSRRAFDCTGYYLDSDCMDTIHPVVYSLTHGRYLAGGDDPHNGDMKTGAGPAWLSLEVFDDLLAACRRAHQLCERYAENERAYNDAWRAGTNAANEIANAESARPEALALCDEIKRAKRAKRGLAWGTVEESDFANICTLARRRIIEIRAAITRARDNRESARQNNAHYADAFADGLGQGV